MRPLQNPKSLCEGLGPLLELRRKRADAGDAMYSLGSLFLFLCLHELALSMQLLVSPLPRGWHRRGSSDVGLAKFGGRLDWDSFHG